MKTLDLCDFNRPVKFPLPSLRPGMCVVLWTDQGPGGPCGQSMRTTCPWGGLAIFPNIDTAKEHLEAHPPRKGSRQDIRYFVVGNYGTGQFSVSVHEDCC